jgi:hypothetical protein
MNHLTDNDSRSTVSNVDYAKEVVVVQEASDNEDILKGHLNTALVLN